MKFILALLIAGVAALWFLGEPAVNDPSPLKPISDIERELREMNRTVTSLQAKSQKTGAQTRAEVERVVKTLQDQINATQRRLSDLQSATRRSNARGRIVAALRKIKRWILDQKEEKK